MSLSNVATADTYSSANTKFLYLVSLGWLSNDENSINVIDLTNESITNELLQRYCSERTNLPTKIEHAKDDASTYAVLSGRDSEIAINEAEAAVLKKGLGVTFWCLTADKYHCWKNSWEKRDHLIDEWLATNGMKVLRTTAYEEIENDYMRLFETEPLIRIDLSCETMGLKKSQEIALKIMLATHQKDG